MASCSVKAEERMWKVWVIASDVSINLMSSRKYEVIIMIYLYA